MKTGTYKIPYDSDGNLMHYAEPDDYLGGAFWKAHEWRENKPFRAKMSIDSWARGRSAAYFIFRDQSGKKYPMFMKDFMSMLEYVDIIGFKSIKHKVYDGPMIFWQCVKRGQNYGLVLAGDEAYGR